MQPQFPVPDPLPILTLPEPSVLFPGQLLSLHLQTPHTLKLVRAVLQDSSGSPQSPALVIGCVPLKPAALKGDNATEGDAQGSDRAAGEPGSDAAERIRPAHEQGTDDDQQRERGLQVIRLGTDKSSNAVAADKPDPSDLFEFGTLARIVRLERLSTQAGSGLIVVLSGLARFSYSPSALDPSAPFYTAAAITVHNEPSTLSLSPASAPDTTTLVAALRDSATSLVETLSTTSTLPPLVIRRLRGVLSRLSPSTAPALLDALLAALPVHPTSGLTHADKVRLLGTLDAAQRVDKGVEVLGRAEEALKLAGRIEGRVEEGQKRRQREWALLQQLMAIRQELEQLAKEEGRPSPLSIIGGGGSGAAKGAAGAPGGRRALGSPPGIGAGDDADEEDDLAELERRVAAKAFSPEAKCVAVRELKRLKKTPPQGAEHGVIRNYIDTLLSVPWTAAEATPLELSKDFVALARKKLDDDHYGLDKIKKRLLEWLAVLRLQREHQALAHETTLAAAPSSPTESAVAAPPSSTATAKDPAGTAPAPTPPFTPAYRAPILLLHGPPGTGKTSIARSLAEAMGRKFVRISLGGVRDEAEIRGHRRTYVGAMPGKIVAALRKAGVSNPVVLLDEVDKIGHASHHGDPNAALLEVLDPEQNNSFEDHYLGVPLDLSQVLFIATANSLDTIPEPLFDRMEAIELSGYVHAEKLHIARQSLLPKQQRANALSPSQLSLSDDVLLRLVTSYTREAGVRSLERALGAVCRAKAVELAESADERDAAAGGAKAYAPEVTEEDLERILGPPRWEEEDEDGGRVGVATGLAYQGSGNGGILHIETTLTPGTGTFSLTGQLGSVISESAHVALAWVKAHAFELGIAPDRDANAFDKRDVHVHFPAGAVKKDGPSAGVALVVAIVSLMRGIPPRAHTAMTGEVTLRGLVTPVGGIKEKILAAHRAGITRAILPLANKRDVETDLPAQVRAEVEFVYVRTVDEALDAAFEGGLAALAGGGGGGKAGERGHGAWDVQSHL
ncbi:Lon protease C-terminal proteolytic domain-containing protein [Rhodotorula diobovata]|uniref:Lon protease homolog n=1 Tax=Rhodotorula diobovata TaxID=5288 RepID=A0A5C5FKR2_9BASI|nr:Lon protease C-terminal proteolytic domain-containing protein [Rhodotorula diobovata]